MIAVAKETVILKLEEFKQLQNLVFSLNHILQQKDEEKTEALLDNSGVDGQSGEEEAPVEDAEYRYKLGNYSIVQIGDTLQFFDEKQFLNAFPVLKLCIYNCAKFLNRFLAAINYYIMFLEKY